MNATAQTLGSDRPLTVYGVPGRLTHQTTKPGQAPGLWFNQRWISEARQISGYGPGAKIRAELRYDDNCGNGHNDFAITGDVYRLSGKGPYGGKRIDLAGGCLHEDIAKAFPELAPLIAWHLCGETGPMHYAANVVYFAGDRDHNGLRKGETRPLATRDGRTFWKLVAVNAPGVAISDTPTGKEYAGAETVPLFILQNRAKGNELPPVVPVLRWIQETITGEGKERQLDLARSAAVWPEATDEELSAEPEILRAALLARLPALLQRFRAAIEGAGFAWAPPEPRDDAANVYRAEGEEVAP